MSKVQVQEKVAEFHAEGQEKKIVVKVDLVPAGLWEVLLSSSLNTAGQHSSIPCFHHPLNKYPHTKGMVDSLGEHLEYRDKVFMMEKGRYVGTL